MSEDDERARQRLLALEREVRAEADAKAARKAEALERVRAERARQEAERQALRDRQAELVSRRARPTAEAEPEREEPDGADDRLAGGGRGRELARRADDVRQELSRPRAAHEKSWALSAGASFLLGPLGWLYAGSWREAIPASAAYLAAAMILRMVPTFLLMPVMMVAMPASALAGLLYALRYNRNGRRMRLFGPDAPSMRLGGGASGGGKGGGKALPPGKPRR